LVALTSRHRFFWFALAFSVGCTAKSVSPPPVSTPSPAPIPAPTTSATDSTSVGSWSFNYAPGPAVYQVTRSAEVRRTDSSTTSSAKSGNSTHEILTFEVKGPESVITAVVDSFTPITQELIGQQNQLPVQISASLASGGLTINDSSNTTTCSVVRSVLTTDLENLVIPFPSTLTSGSSWKDSLDIKGCQAGIPISTHLTRFFRVKGQRSYGAYQVLEIARSDSAEIDGEGGLQQHHLTMHAVGTATGTYYLSVNTGQILRLAVDQLLDIHVSTVGTKAQFRQRSQQEFVLTP
jgi:hypothetical protein